MNNVVVANALALATLEGFRDQVVAKIELERGSWLLMARVTVTNVDGDPQHGSARIVHDANVILMEDQPARELPGDGYSICFYLQAGFVIEKAGETITLECNTHDGFATNASLIALQVDGIQFQ
jgi:hypothetical protein